MSQMRYDYRAEEKNSRTNSSTVSPLRYSVMRYWIDPYNKQAVGYAIPRIAIIGFGGLLLVLMTEVLTRLRIATFGDAGFVLPTSDILIWLSLFVTVAIWMYSFKYVGYYNLNADGTPEAYIARNAPAYLGDFSTSSKNGFREKIAKSN